MEVRNTSGTLLQYMLFDIVLYPDQTIRYKLDKIRFYDGNNNFVNQYTFGYNPRVIPHYLQTNAVDFWGYYNGEEGNLNLLPKWNFTLQPELPGSTVTRTLGTANRQANEFYMTAMMLEQITYPTGGRTVFQYEANRHSPSTGTLAQAGGLRIKTITNYDLYGNISGSKRYAYGVNESGAGVLEVPPTIDNFHYTLYGAFMQCAGMRWDFRRSLFTSEPLVNLAPHGSPVIYYHVAEYTTDGTTDIGKVVYDYSYRGSDYKTYSTNNTVLGKTNFPVNQKKYVPWLSDWSVGVLESETTYRKNGTLYDEVSSMNYQYDDFMRDTLRNYMQYRLAIPFSPCWGLDGSCNESDMDLTMANNNNVTTPFLGADYYYLSGEKRLKQTIEVKDNVRTVTQFAYENSPLTVPTQATVINSKNEAFVTKTKYPYHFSSTTSPNVYNTLVNLNRVNTVIETETYKGTTFLESTKTNYYDWGSQVVAPITVDARRAPDAAPRPNSGIMVTTREAM